MAVSYGNGIFSFIRNQLSSSHLFIIVTKISEKNNLKEETDSLAHGFTSFSSCLVCFIALGLKQGRISWQKGMVEESCYLTVSRKQREGKGPGTSDSPQGHTLSTKSLQLGSTSCSFHHLPIMSSNYELINGITH